MKKQNLRLEIKKVLSYFSHFLYAPTAHEIYTFLEKPSTREDMNKTLEKMAKEGAVGKKTLKKQVKYTLGEYSNKAFRRAQFKLQTSQFKITKIQPYIKILAKLPQIKLIGLSGSVAMLDAPRSDDIDLFIITSSHRMWTGRLLSILVAELMRIRRRAGSSHDSVKDQICLNLFFDEKGLKIPRRKQTKFVAHEVLQMKPLFVRNNAYNRFLEANSWVFKIFPNAASSLQSNFLPQLGPVPIKIELPQNRKNSTSSFWEQISNLTEFLLKKFQLWLINRHRTTEIITDTQLWFFPDDFERKLHKK